MAHQDGLGAVYINQYFRFLISELSRQHRLVVINGHRFTLWKCIMQLINIGFLNLMNAAKIERAKETCK